MEANILTHKLIFKGKIVLLSGLHIGDSKETTDIGGVDSPIIRNKITNRPYIPGSSLKGKIRSLLEISSGENPDSNFNNADTLIGELFGAAGITENGRLNFNKGKPSRIIFRDADLLDTDQRLEKSPYTDMPFSEIKFENVIDRINGVTKKGGLRQIERVPAGAEFNLEIIINIIVNDKTNSNIKIQSYTKLLKNGIKLLEHDYLGGSGSRGYGQVKIELQEPEIIDVAALIKS